MYTDADAQKHRVAMCSDVVNARLNHKTALTLEVTATKPKESIRNKSGKDAIHTLQNNPSQPARRLHNTNMCDSNQGWDQIIVSQ